MPNLDEDLQNIVRQGTAQNSLQQVIRVAQLLPREEAAKILRISSATGDSADVVAANLRNYDLNDVANIDWEQAFKEAPRMKGFVTSNPLAMSVVRDQQNAAVLAELENQNKISNAVQNGLKGVGRYGLRLAQGVFENLSVEPEEPTYFKQLTPEYNADTTQPGTEIMKSLAVATKSMAESKILREKEVKADTVMGQWGLDFVQMLPQVVAQLGVALITKNPGVAAGFMGTQIAGADYEKYRSEGVEPGRAMKAAIGDAAAQAPLEAIGLSRIMRKLPKGSSATERLKQYVSGGLKEGLTEWVQQYPQGAADIYAANPDASVGQMLQMFGRDFWKNTKEGLYQGSVALPLGVLGGAFNHAMQRKATEAYVHHLETQQAVLANSPLVKISPEIAEQALEAIDPNAKTYIDPDALVMYQMENPKVLETLGISENELEQALQTGEMIEVPESKYAVATKLNPEIHDALKDDIASDVDGYTLRRIKERRDNADIKRAAGKVDEEEKALKGWKQEYAQHLKDAGVSTDVANQIMVGLQSHARVMSDKPAEWLKENAPVFQQGESMQEGALAQFAGVKAATADTMQLNKAEELLASGADPEAIRQQTGWFKGMDGKWRFEIDDSKAKFKPTKSPMNSLEDVLDHPDLYAAYPNLKDMDVYVTALNEHTSGFYNREDGGSITINKNLSDEEKMATLLHEAQHAIQHHEGHARGSSPDANDQSDSASGGDDYNNSAGEIEARDTEGRANMSQGERRAARPDLRDNAIVVFGGKEYAYNKKAADTYYQPLNHGVDANQKVSVVDISGNVPQGVTTHKELLDFVKQLVGEKMTTADNQAIVSVLPKDVRHIVFSSKKAGFKKEETIRQGSILSLKDLINNAVLIESIPNTKVDKKPDVAAYHRLYVPVRFDGKIETIRLVVEEQNGSVSLHPADVNLYDVIVENKKPVAPNQPTSRSGRSGLEAATSFGEISIRQMLSGVKDSEKVNYFHEGKAAKGSISWDEDGRAIITMFEKADASTVVHEMVGHYFFQNLVERAKMDNAPEQVKKDVKTLMEWAGVEGDFDSLTNEEKVAVHEKVARAAEAYVMTGKAPSVATQGMFRRFVDWMKKAYQSVRELGVNVTPEVSAVFDRMLATDAEIAELEAVEEYRKTLPEDFLQRLTPGERAVVDKRLSGVRVEAEKILRAELMADLSTERKEELAKLRSSLTEKFMQEMKNEPLFRAMELIEQEIGGGLEGVHKIAWSYRYDKLDERYAAHFDFIAEQMGFTSGDELAQRIGKTKILKNAVAERVNQYIKDNHPELFGDKEAMQEKAREALYNDKGAALLAMEQGLIRKIIESTYENRWNSAERKSVNEIEDAPEKEKAREKEAVFKDKVAAAVMSVKYAAKEIMSKRTIAEATQLQSFIAAERRAAIDADRCLRNKDYEGAAAAKERQLLNHALIQESLRIRRETNRIKNYLNKQRKTKNWLSDATDENGMRIKTNEYKDQAMGILSRFGIGSKEYVAPEEPLSEWIKRQEQDEVNGAIINIASWLGYDNVRKDISKLTIEELQDVEAAIQNLKTMARIGVNADGFTFINNEGKEATVTSLMERSSQLKDKQIDRIEKEKTTWLQEMRAGQKQAHRIFEALDGFGDFGPWYMAFYGSIKRAADFKSSLLSRVTTRIEDAFTSESIGKAERYRMAHKKIYIPEWKQSVTKNTLLAIGLNMGNKGNLERLVATRLVGVDNSVTWDADSIKAVLENNLTASEVRLIGKIWKAIDVYAEYNDMVKRMTGNELPRVEPVPITFRVGGEEIMLDGGYYPLSQDSRSSRQAELNAEKKIGDTPGMMPYPSKGRSKARAKNAKYAVDTDFANMYGNISEIVQDIAFRPVAHDINKLMRDNRVKELLRSKLGDAEYRTILEWQKRVTTGRSETVKGVLDSFFNWARGATVVSSLLMRPGVALQNIVNFSLYGNDMKSWSNQDTMNAYLRHGWSDYIPNALRNTDRAKELREFVYSRSVQMRDKMENPDYTFREINGIGQTDNRLMDVKNEIVQEVGYKYALAQQDVNKFASDVFAWTDQLTDIPVWIGAYEKAKAEGKTERQAVDFADAIIRNGTGTGRGIDTSRLQASGSASERLFTMFQTFLNTAYNRWAKEYNIYLQEKDHARLIKFVAVQYLMFGALSAIFSFKWPDDDEDPFKWFAKEVLEWPLGMIPLFGGIAKVAMDQAMGFKTFGYTATPVESKARDVLKLATTATQVYEGKKDIGDMAEPTMNVASFFMKYPDQLNDWFFNAYDVLSGNMSPEWRDLVRRRPMRERK